MRHETERNDEQQPPTSFRRPSGGIASARPEEIWGGEGGEVFSVVSHEAHQMRRDWNGGEMRHPAESFWPRQREAEEERERRRDAAEAMESVPRPSSGLPPRSSAGARCTPAASRARNFGADERRTGSEEGSAWSAAASVVGGGA